MNGAIWPKLRTKTGCLTCRQRRRKCDEKLPICNLCASSGRKCVWPSPGDLLDRRHAAHYDSRHKARTSQTKVERQNSLSNDAQHPGQSEELVQTRPLVAHGQSDAPAIDSICPLNLLSEAAAVHGVISHNLELLFSRHFAEKYFSLLLLPSCHRGFHDGWLADIQQLMVVHKSLYYSVLACAASHIFLSDDSSWEIQDLALTYYSKALRELSSLLASISEHENHNGLLMSVMLLYLHGSLGWGTDNDIPRHVNAATRIVTLRLIDRPVGIQRLFDRLAIESVVYQQFLVTSGLWSDTDETSYTYDTEFWDGVEKLLDRSTLLSGAPRNLESPILGVPVSLFRLVLVLRQCYRTGDVPDPVAVEQMQSDLAVWEGLLLCDQDSGPVSDGTSIRERFFRDETYLHTMVASLLLEQITKGEKCKGLPSMVDSDAWQIRMSLQILERHKHDPMWPQSYIGNWPIYTLGLFMSRVEDRGIIRDDLERRWSFTRTSQVTRFSRDLEEIWEKTSGN